MTIAEIGKLVFDSSGKAVTQQDNLIREEGTEYKITRPEFRETPCLSAIYNDFQKLEKWCAL